MSVMLWEGPLVALDKRITELEAQVRALTTKKKQKSGEPTATGVSPDRFYRILVESGKVVGGAVDPASFGTIGRKMNKSGVVAEDVDKFQTWVNEGGLNWVKEPFTWNSICRAPKFMLLDWIARAKVYTAQPKPLSFGFDDLLSSMRASKKDAQ